MFGEALRSSGITLEHFTSVAETLISLMAFLIYCIFCYVYVSSIGVSSIKSFFRLLWWDLQYAASPCWALGVHPSAGG